MTEKTHLGSSNDGDAKSYEQELEELKKKDSVVPSWGQVSPQSLVGRCLKIRMPGEDHYTAFQIKDYDAETEMHHLVTPCDWIDIRHIPAEDTVWQDGHPGFPGLVKRSRNVPKASDNENVTAVEGHPSESRVAERISILSSLMKEWNSDSGTQAPKSNENTNEKSLVDLQSEAYYMVLHAFSGESPQVSRSRIMIVQDLKKEWNISPEAHTALVNKIKTEPLVQRWRNVRNALKLKIEIIKLQREAFYGLVQAFKAESGTLVPEPRRLLVKELIKEWNLSNETITKLSEKLKTDTQVQKFRNQALNLSSDKTRLNELQRQAFYGLLQAFNAETGTQSEPRRLLTQDLAKEWNLSKETIIELEGKIKTDAVVQKFRFQNQKASDETDAPLNKDEKEVLEILEVLKTTANNTNIAHNHGEDDGRSDGEEIEDRRRPNPLEMFGRFSPKRPRTKRE
ncbi:unnamed protein product [Arabis nemorensis]|uniref:ENT domain-containing protein n=1 Tax=Arabis nemorensis TaxID=586526 RepID=A0A565BXG7_9BRAS|nr:unnamed protein product [Arabis nemorensis]